MFLAAWSSAKQNLVDIELVSRPSAAATCTGNTMIFEREFADMINGALGCMTEEMIEALKCREEEEKAAKEAARAAAAEKKKPKDDPKDPKEGGPKGGDPKGGASGGDPKGGASGGSTVGASGDPSAAASNSNTTPQNTAQPHNSLGHTRSEPFLPVSIVENNLKMISTYPAKALFASQNVLETFHKLAGYDPIKMSSPTAAPGLIDWNVAQTFKASPVTTFAPAAIVNEALTGTKGPDGSSYSNDSRMMLFDTNKPQVAGDSNIAQLFSSAPVPPLDKFPSGLTDEDDTIEEMLPSHDSEPVAGSDHSVSIDESEIHDVDAPSLLQDPVESAQTQFLIEPPISEGIMPLTGAEDTVSRPGPEIDNVDWPVLQDDLPYSGCTVPFIKPPAVESNENKDEPPLTLEVPPVAETQPAGGEALKSEPLRYTALSQEEIDEAMQKDILKHFDNQFLAAMAAEHIKDCKDIATVEPGNECHGANLDENLSKAVEVQANDLQPLGADALNSEDVENLSEITESSEQEVECDDRPEKDKKSLVGNLLSYVTKFWKSPKED